MARTIARTIVRNRPIISILMPSYNSIRYVTEAVASILAQTLEDFEFVIVDDASKDGSYALLKKFALMDRRIQLIKNRSNQGVAGALNTGLARCQGRWIARMDSDDIACPNRLMTQLARAQKDPKLVLLGSNVRLMDADGNVSPTVHLPTRHSQIDRSLLSGGWPIIHPSTLIRKSALEKIGGYQSGLGTLEDHDLFLRLAEVGKLANLPRSLLNYRLHSSSVCQSQKNPIPHLKAKLICASILRRGWKKPPKSIFQNPNMGLLSGQTETTRRIAAYCRRFFLVRGITPLDHAAVPRRK